MNVSSFLSVKDFFNYYVAGFLWIVLAIIISMPLNNYEESLAWLKNFQNISNLLGAVFTGIILVVVPYVIGFVATPVSMFFTKLLKKVFGDPKIWVIDYSEKNTRHTGKRLAQTKIQLIVKRLKKVFGNEKKINQDNLKNWFFSIRAYVINSPGEAASFAIRAQDLVNFTESIILPLPLIFIIIGLKTYSQSIFMNSIFEIVGVCTLCLLSYRYLKLRFYWVKHIYNTFLVVTSKFEK